MTARGDIDTLLTVFAAHPDVARDDRILEESAGYNRTEITQLILDAGATMQGTGEHYLAYAVAHGPCDTADLLVRLGATSNVIWVAAGLGFLDAVASSFDAVNNLKPKAWTGRRNWEDFGMPEHPLPQDAEAADPASPRNRMLCPCGPVLAVPVAGLLALPLVEIPTTAASTARAGRAGWLPSRMRPTELHSRL